MTYPNWFPKNCPPADCEMRNKLLYRLCKGSNPNPDDFLSYYLLGKKFSGVNGYGISMLASLEDAKKYFLLPAKVVKDKRFHSIAKGFTEDDGVWKYTHSDRYKSHVTWWLKDGAEPWKRFEIVKD